MKRVLVVGGAVVGWLAVRRLGRRSGATGREAAPEQVWSWIVQRVAA